MVRGPSGPYTLPLLPSLRVQALDPRSMGLHLVLLSATKDNEETEAIAIVELRARTVTPMSAYGVEIGLRLLLGSCCPASVSSNLPGKSVSRMIVA